MIPPTVFGILMVILFHGTLSTSAFHKNIVTDTFQYDTIINLIINETTEYIMEFTEKNKDWRVFPTRVHVSTNNSVDSDYPLFVTATQQKDVSSWQLPLEVSTPTGALRYTNVGRTLCPYDVENNVTSLPPLLQISTSNPNNVAVDIKLRRVVDFQIALNNEVTLQAAPGTPKYYYFSFQQSPWNITQLSESRFNITIPKNVILMIESPDDICAAVSVQNNSCPVFDNEKDLTYQGYYFTMTKKGGITLTDSMFPSGFYLVFVVKENDASCSGLQNSHNDTRNRIKTFSFRVVATISYSEYVAGGALLLAAMLAVALLAVLLLLANRYIQPRLVAVDAALSSSLEDEAGLLNQNMQEPVRREQEWPLTMASLCTVPLDVHAERSHRYFWTVLTVSIVYALPVFQLLASYQRMVFQTGNQDLCYYNYLCAHPLGALADFNHVYSNIGYVVLGGVFMCITRRRQLQAKQRPPDVGVRQHFGILYSLGLALIMEGVLSACYHFCPNKMNFQFDSSFMYLLGVLCAVSLHSARRPDLAPHAHKTALALAAAMTLGLCGIMYPSVYYCVAFTILHLTLCFVFSIDIYYFGRVKLDRQLYPRVYLALREAGVRAALPEHRVRAALLSFAVFGNVALAVYGLLQYKIDFAHHLLAIIMGNAVVFCLMYLVLKLVHREIVLPHTWLSLLLAGAFWALALSYFRDSTTKWSERPAESRSRARVCSLLMFDEHDAWHASSAAAVFFSLLTLLTADDALLNTHNSKIHVF